MNIVLASSSPRRCEILKNLNIDFKVMPSGIEENIECENPYDMVKKLSYMKAHDIAKDNKSSLVIGADTIVYLEGRILGKPSSNEEAYKMLKLLSGKAHEVITGISIIYEEKNINITDAEITKVFFKNLSDEEIQSYIKTKEPLDKAGAYGIQGIASVFVEKIEGCYFNVVGLPTNKLYNLLGNAGINLLIKE